PARTSSSTAADAVRRADHDAPDVARSREGSMRGNPAPALAATALFFALGGSAIAVNEAVRPQARCQPGAVRGYAAVNREAAKGKANFPAQFTSAKPLIGARFNCAGAAPQARRVNVGVYGGCFPGNATAVATASS